MTDNVIELGKYLKDDDLQPDGTDGIKSNMRKLVEMGTKYETSSGETAIIVLAMLLEKCGLEPYSEDGRTGVREKREN